jgi:hypothetical protein
MEPRPLSLPEKKKLWACMMLLLQGQPSEI